jgi:pyruvate,water dikinase
MKPITLTESIDESSYGGKAAQLAAAVRAGLPVPGGVALPVGFVDAVATDQPDAIRKLEESCVTLDGPVAVRSSAVGEDSETASFAGQHLTCLNVQPSLPALADAVRAIWESAHSESALAYRQRLGLSSEPRIGVVVQELVVAGLVTPDRFRISREGTVLERTSGMKDVAIHILPEGGTQEFEVPAECVHALCLNDAQLRELHALATRCEKTFGGTQDLEWAFGGNTLYLLQRRAVTRGLNVESGARF